MKKIFLTTLLMIVFLLNGCASDSTETQIESYDTQETLQVNKKSSRSAREYTRLAEEVMELCQQAGRVFGEIGRAHV